MESAVDTLMKVLEFYSGIGGMRYSLEAAGLSATVVEAFDINEVANDVYEHNFGHRPNQGNIQRLTVQQLDKYKADAWLLSPPCQPYTRQGLKKDIDDGRATSFLQLLQLLPDMSSPPSYVFVENVVGFECSMTHDCLRDVLAKAEFEIQEFILSPLQFGIPYSRPRYFCLAKRKPLLFTHMELNGSLLCKPGPLQVAEIATCDMQGICETPYKPGVEARGLNEPELDPAVICYRIGDYIEPEPRDKEAHDELVLASAIDNVAAIVCHGEIPDRATTNPSKHDPAPSEIWKDFMVPISTIMRWGDVFDIVTPESKRCCCFTKSYTRFAKGTGSFLAMKTSDPDFTSGCQESSLTDRSLRYFTPREVANLHSFPTSFTFPAHVTMKQRYALLGNSLSVAVVGRLLRYLFQSEEENGCLPADTVSHYS